MDLGPLVGMVSRAAGKRPMVPLSPEQQQLEQDLESGEALQAAVEADEMAAMLVRDAEMARVLSEALSSDISLPGSKINVSFIFDIYHMQYLQAHKYTLPLISRRPSCTMADRVQGPGRNAALSCVPGTRRRGTSRRPKIWARAWLGGESRPRPRAISLRRCSRPWASWRFKRASAGRPQRRCM